MSAPFLKQEFMEMLDTMRDRLKNPKMCTKHIGNDQKLLAIDIVDARATMDAAADVIGYLVRTIQEQQRLIDAGDDLNQGVAELLKEWERK